MREIKFAPSAAKAAPRCRVYGTTKVVPFRNAAVLARIRLAPDAEDC
jgi:hypothetical protein